MDGPQTAHRLHFAFTITYHYIFPQLTMGLAALIVVLKTLAVRRGDAVAADGVRFFSRILAVSFVMGVVTGIPMEIQFGTNWARFAEAAGGVIGHTLAMEGVFAFFLESWFLYLLLFEERRLGPRGHWIVAVIVCAGTWLSGFFIITTNAWMQHPVGHVLTAGGVLELESFWALFANPWLPWQLLHTMLGALVTGCFFVASLGAFYLLLGKHERHARLFVQVAVAVGLPATLLVAFPAGDMQARKVAAHQPVAFAAMEGHFKTERGAGLVVIGQPDMEHMRLDNPIVLPHFLSVMTHQRWRSEIKGLEDFPREDWPDNVPLLYYAYHVMVGLGTLFIGVMALAGFSLHRKRLFERRWLLWILALALPFPFIANTLGWLTAELGRQPWLVYGVMRTSAGYSTAVSSGNTLFTLLGFMGLYALLSLLFFFLMIRIVARGPVSDVA